MRALTALVLVLAAASPLEATQKHSSVLMCKTVKEKDSLISTLRAAETPPWGITLEQWLKRHTTCRQIHFFSSMLVPLGKEELVRPNGSVVRIYIGMAPTMKGSPYIVTSEQLPGWAI